MTELLGRTPSSTDHSLAWEARLAIPSSSSDLSPAPAALLPQAHSCPFSQRAHRTLDVAELGHGDSPQLRAQALFFLL